MSTKEKKDDSECYCITCEGLPNPADEPTQEEIENYERRATEPTPANVKV